MGNPQAKTTPKKYPEHPKEIIYLSLGKKLFARLQLF
jgi:hypothetical protein